MFVVAASYWKEITMKYWYCCCRLRRCLFQHVVHVTLPTTAPINAALTNLPYSGNHIFQAFEGHLLTLTVTVTQLWLTFTTILHCRTHIIQSVFIGWRMLYISVLYSI